MKDIADVDKSAIENEETNGGYETDFSASTIEDSNENIFDNDNDHDFDDHVDFINIQDMGLS